MRKWAGEKVSYKMKMKSERGYALVVMVFIVTAFLSVVFLLCCPVVKEAREDADSYIIDRNDYRYRKAMFGMSVDQCGSKLPRSGGYYDDNIFPGKTGTKGYMHHTLPVARVTGTMGSAAIGGYRPRIPMEYEFPSTYAFWRGFWGKRYLKVLPSDKWDYYTLYYDLEGPGWYDTGYDPFAHMYVRITMNAICGGITKCKNKIKKTYCAWEPCGGGIVKLKDYSEERMVHKLRLVIIGAVNNPGSVFSETSKKEYTEDYVYYEFIVSGGSFIRNLARHIGQKKLLIQAKEDPANPGSPWITMDTKLLIWMPSTGNGAKSNRYAVNFYE